MSATNTSPHPLITEALKHLQHGHTLTQSQMQALTRVLMQGEATDAQIAALLMGLSVRGETTDELEGAARAMRELMEPVELPDLTERVTIDIVGTGGDGANLMNISTAAALVTSAAGVRVAKHGNRQVSSKSGSADLLEAAGLRLDLNSAQVQQVLDALGIGFMFAVQHHPAMRHVVGTRRQLGVRTVFNLLGPLTNPAGVQRHVIGVFDPKWCRPVAEVLQRLGSTHALVVHSRDGLDEISLAAPTDGMQLRDGHVAEWHVAPEDVGLHMRAIDTLAVTDPRHALSMLKDALGRKKSATGQLAADMIALNAGAALYMTDTVPNLRLGVELAHDVIAGGQALEKLDNLAEFTQTLKRTEVDLTALRS